MRAVRHSSAPVAFALLLLPVDAGAQAPRRPTDIEACFGAAERAQPLMRDRKLRAASKELAVCSRDVCPRAVRGDCRAWLDELARVQPTVVFRAREARTGGAVAVDDVKVSVDGEAIVTAIDETPVPLDPGAHVFRFEHGSFPAVEQRLELREGEARRVVDVEFRAGGDASTSSSATVAATPATTSTPPSSSSDTASPGETPGASAPVPVLAWGLLGGGVVALGVGIAFEATGLSSRSSLAGSCGATKSCAQSDVDSAHNQVLVGDIGVGIGAALLVGAAYVYLTRAPDAPSHDAAMLRFGFGPVPGGIAASLAGSL